MLGDGQPMHIRGLNKNVQRTMSTLQERSHVAVFSTRRGLALVLARVSYGDGEYRTIGVTALSGLVDAATPEGKSNG